MSAEPSQPNQPAQPSPVKTPPMPAMVKKANESAIRHILCRKGAEDAQHDASMRRVLHNRLRHELAVATNLKDVANAERMQIICKTFLYEPDELNRELAKNQERIDKATAEEAQAAEALAAFEAAEEMREHGRIGDIVMMLVRTMDAQEARIAALEAKRS